MSHALPRCPIPVLTQLREDAREKSEGRRVLTPASRLLSLSNSTACSSEADRASSVRPVEMDTTAILQDIPQNTKAKKHDFLPKDTAAINHPQSRYTPAILCSY